jgi:ferrous iron transport protein A
MRRSHWFFHRPIRRHPWAQAQAGEGKEDDGPSKARRAAGPCPLTAVPSKETATVHDLRGGACFRSRLAALGFTPGVAVTVLQNRRFGPMLVMVRDTRIALGRGEARKILVDVDGGD